MAGDLMPFLVNVLLQVCYAGMNIISMLAMQSGMHPLVLVAYRQVFATMAIAPFAYFMECSCFLRDQYSHIIYIVAWGSCIHFYGPQQSVLKRVGVHKMREGRTRPRITLPILLEILVCSLTGATGNQLAYFVGLKNSTPTIGCALTNTLPAFTFILAVLFRQETVGIKTKAGQAKVIGTIVCVGGALLLSFYHGHTIDIKESSIHWTYAQNMEKKSSISSDQKNPILGPVFLIFSSLSWALWFILQARLNERFPAPYTSTTLMCFMASIECGIIALIPKHDKSSWSLADPMRLFASLYAGCVCSAIAFVIISWAIHMKGPLYVSVFSPLLLVIVAISSWALLGEKLYVGTALGSLLIVMGLYAVLWGKNKETRVRSSGFKNSESTKVEDEKEDLELQFDAKSNGNYLLTTREEKQQEK